MSYKDKWEIINEIGGGGQGTVYRVYDKTIKKQTDNVIAEFLNSIKVAHIDDIKKKLDEFFNFAYKRLSIYDIASQKALKILHKPVDARDSELAKERIKIELKAMHELQHPNLLKVIEFDDNEHWFISEYYKNGTLDANFDQFIGKAIISLKTIRPLIEAVSELHKNNFVHRDIKPENIFIGLNYELILGDFGLIFFNDNKHTRISNTFSNVGSRDWMPGWAMGKRIEDIKPSFDVYSLGKIIWSMISGIPVLPLWYFKEPENNLEQLYPEKREMKLINKLLAKCIVEKEKDCITNAEELLIEIDNTINCIESKIETLNINEKRSCKICDKGVYEIISKGDNTQLYNFGIRPTGNQSFLIFACNKCGHVQFFSHYFDQLPEAWEA